MPNSVTALLLLAATAALAQSPASGPAKAPPQPAPRLANGRVDFSGVWRPGDIFLIEDISLGLKKGDIIAPTPATEEVMKKHLSKDDPESGCLPTGVPRQAPYPWKIVESPPYIYFLFEGNIHSYRQIFMDGRKHPADPDPTWYGDSIGHFEEDTLVIDSVGFNDKFWFDFAGHPHTEQLHVVERFRRPDLGHLEYEATITDPGAYTKPFTMYGHSTMEAGVDLQEYICNENNQDVPHIVGKDNRK
jgi:hypothetical protein